MSGEREKKNFTSLIMLPRTTKDSTDLQPGQVFFSPFMFFSKELYQTSQSVVKSSELICLNVLWFVPINFFGAKYESASRLWLCIYFPLKRHAHHSLCTTPLSYIRPSLKGLYVDSHSSKASATLIPDVVCVRRHSGGWTTAWGLAHCGRLWVTTMCSCSDNSSEWMRKSYGIQWLGVSGSESKNRCAMWKMCFLVHVALRSYLWPDLLVEKMAEDFVIHAK